MTSAIIADIDLTRFADPYPPEQRTELRDQNARAGGLWTRLQSDDVPGVILGDEVGKGKTYIALALAFATLATKRHARILVLTHSRSMARTWAARWRKEIREMVHHRWREHFDADWHPHVASQYAEFIDALETTAGTSAILFASYDTLKRFHGPEGRRRHLLGALKLAYRAHHLRLSRMERLRLVKAVVSYGGTMPRIHSPVDKKAAVKMLKAALDPATRDWRRKSHRIIENFLDAEAGRHLDIHPKINLLIVDEAHKLEGERRGSVVTHLLGRKFIKGIWVTATPFALSISELRRRLLQFQQAASAKRKYGSSIYKLPLDDYQTAVSGRVDFSQLAELQTALRKRMVRSTWNNREERRILDWTGEATGAALLPSMALERVIANVMSAGERTHIASVRETLCSSWAATLESLQSGALKRFRDDPWVVRLQKVLTDTIQLDPKLGAAVERLVTLTQAGEKTVVFTHRTATSEALVEALQQDPDIRALTSKFQKAARRWRQRADRVQRALKIPTMRQAYTVAKVIAFSPDAPASATPNELKAWWDRHERTFEALQRSADKRDIFDFLDPLQAREGAYLSWRAMTVRFPGVTRADPTLWATIVSLTCHAHPSFS